MLATWRVVTVLCLLRPLLCLLRAPAPAGPAFVPDSGVRVPDESELDIFDRSADGGTAWYNRVVLRGQPASCLPACWWAAMQRADCHIPRLNGPAQPPAPPIGQPLLLGYPTCPQERPGPPAA